MSIRDDLVALIKDPASYLDSRDAVLRRMAITALPIDVCLKMFDVLVNRLDDADPHVRAAAAERLGACGVRALPALSGAEADEAGEVREAVATAYGEIGVPEPIEWLTEVGGSDTDRTVREAAVAALGAIGDDRAVSPLLDFISSGPPGVRRRAIAAITVYDDPRIKPKIIQASLDHNPGVRETAEMVIGRQLNTGD